MARDLKTINAELAKARDEKQRITNLQRQLGAEKRHAEKKQKDHVAYKLGEAVLDVLGENFDPLQVSEEELSLYQERLKSFLIGWDTREGYFSMAMFPNPEEQEELSEPEEQETSNYSSWLDTDDEEKR